MRTDESYFDAIVRFEEAVARGKDNPFLKQAEGIERARHRARSRDAAAQTIEGQTDKVLAEGRAAIDDLRTSGQTFKTTVPEQPKQPTSVTHQETESELFTLKPAIWGCSIDLKEVGRRVKRWWAAKVR